jgi:hypothetical protein
MQLRKCATSKCAAGSGHQKLTFDHGFATHFEIALQSPFDHGGKLLRFQPSSGRKVAVFLAGDRNVLPNRRRRYVIPLSHHMTGDAERSNFFRGSGGSFQLAERFSRRDS